MVKRHPGLLLEDKSKRGDQVLALGTTSLTGKGSGVETELPFAVVARFKDGRMTHFTDYGDRDRALEAAGLRE
jgi:ketosteroid isomerase-like protein